MVIVKYQTRKFLSLCYNFYATENIFDGFTLSLCCARLPNEFSTLSSRYLVLYFGLGWIRTEENRIAGLEPGETLSLPAWAPCPNSPLSPSIPLTVSFNWAKNQRKLSFISYWVDQLSDLNYWSFEWQRTKPLVRTKMHPKGGTKIFKISF